MRRIVTIIGTDGSGKTTLSGALVSLLNADGLTASHEWLGAESYFMAPVRFVLRKAWVKKAPSADSRGSGSYSGDIASKNGLAQRFPWAVPLYIFVVTADYRFQLFLKLSRNRRKDVIVADRYLFDVAVNLGLTLGWSPERTVEFAQRRLSKMNAPRAGVFLRVEPEVSMARKDDIPDIDYLRLRFRYYEAIANAFGFVVLDGTLPIAENAAWLCEHVYAELAKPYVHYVHANNHDVGGADLVLVSMAAHMRKLDGHGGFRTTVSLRLATDAASRHAEVGTPVFLASFVRPQLTAGVSGLVLLGVRAPATLAQFWRLFGRERPDLVHVNDLYDFLPALAARLRGIPVVYHIRMIKGGVVRKAFSTLLPRVSRATVSVSDAVRRTYFPGEASSGAAVVIHDLAKPELVADPGDVQIPRSRPPELDGPGRLVVMLGRIEEWKGQHVFVDAVVHLPGSVRAGNTFALIGGGVPGKNGYLDRVTADAAAAGIRCLGIRTDASALLLAADVSVHASIQPDPFPGVVIEGLLAGTATVAANDGGVTEMINEQSVGLLYAPGDHVALAAALEQLLTQGDSPRSAYAVAARQRGLELTDAETVDSALADLYREVRGSTPVHASLYPASNNDERNSA